MERTTNFEGFGESAGVGERPSLLVVDFIQGFTDPACSLGSDYDKAVEATKRLLDRFRKQGWPVVFTTTCYDPHFKDGGWFLTKVPALKQLTPDSPWIEVDRRLARRPESEPLIIKKFASAFFGTPLYSMLTLLKADTVIVTGCTTSGCVRASVVDALQYGYRVLVPEACVGDRSLEAHRANLYDMNLKYADVVDLDALLKKMSQIEV